MSSPSLVWSSRENIRAQLVSLLQSLPCEPRKLRYGALRLLGVFGGPEQLPLLRGLLLDPREHFSLRQLALSLGLRHGLRLSGPEFTGLLEGPSPLFCDGHPPEGLCSPSMHMLSELAETDADRAVIEAMRNPASSAEEPSAPLPEPNPGALLPRLRRIVRAESLSYRLPYPFIQNPPEFSWAVEQLRTRSEARPLLYRLLCDLDVAVEVRGELLECLFEQDRAVAARWVLAARAYPENLPIIRDFLRLASLAPRPEERPLFLAALRGEDDLARSFAIEGLRALGESGAGWCDRLTSLVHSPLLAVRLRAAACLIQEGRREWLPLLREMAREAEPYRLRAEALRWLGALDGEASRSVLKQALSGPPMPRVPEANEAMWALSRLGSAEDLSALLDAGLSCVPCSILEQELEYHLARQEGRPTEVPTPPPPRDYMAELHEEPLRAGPGTGAGPASAPG